MPTASARKAKPEPRVQHCPRRRMTTSRFTLILPAAGSSSRFGTNKLLAPLGGEPVFSRTLLAFLDHPSLAAVVIASMHPNALRQAAVKALARAESQGIDVQFVEGGDCRAQSVANAVAASRPDVEWLAIHDAARPLVSRPLIDATLAAAVARGAAAPAVAVTSTVKEATGPLPAKVIRTIPRQSLWALQTPQVIRRTQMLDAIAGCRVPLSEVTDDLQIIELAGGETWLVPGDERNLKLTTAGDLAVAETLLLQEAPTG